MQLLNNDLVDEENSSIDLLTKTKKKSYLNKKGGYLDSIKDNICLVSGLTNCFIGEILYIFTEKLNKIEGLVLNIEDGNVKIVLIKGSQTSLKCGDTVYRTHSLVKTKAGFFVLGRILNPVGETLNTRDISMERSVLDRLLNTDYVVIDLVAPGIVERIGVKKPFLTGVTSIDCFIPIGCGQRELIIGDNNTGKTSLAITSLLNQRYLNNISLWRKLENNIISEEKIFFTPCIFVSIGKKRSEIARLKQLLVSNNAFYYTSFLYTSSDSSASLQYLAPYAGCAMGEWFMNKGYDALIIYDDLSEHAVAYRQMSLLLRRPPGREAYPGDVFYLHSRLLERAAQLSFINGGGSLTALPIVETKGADISAYIPTNIISITDGQLFLTSSLSNKGIRPAIDLQLSVSRVGSAAQYDAMSFVSKKIKFCLSMFHLYEASEKLGAVNDHITPLINRGRRIYRFFTQSVYETVPFYKQIICLYCIGEGYSDRIHLKYIDLFFKMMFDISITKFFISDKSLFLNKEMINSFFINYDFFNDVKDDLDSFCKEYSSFFIHYVQSHLDDNPEDTFVYQELINNLVTNCVYNR